MGVRWCTMLIREQSREVWIFSPIASCCTTLWKTICCPCLLASLAFLFPKLRANKQSKHWVVSEKIHTPTTDGILEILGGGGVKDSGNPGGRGVFLTALLTITHVTYNMKKSSAGVISTDCSRDSNV